MGGAGGSVLLDNVVRGSTSGVLTLSQTAIAGSGSDGAVNGDGGAAVSLLDRSDLNAASLMATAIANSGYRSNHAVYTFWTLISWPSAEALLAWRNCAWYVLRIRSRVHQNDNGEPVDRPRCAALGTCGGVDTSLFGLDGCCRGDSKLVDILRV